MAVINVAGQNILDVKQRWSAGFKQNVWNSRVESTKTLAKAVAANPPKVFATISGVAYYPPNNNEEYNEESVCDKYDFLSGKKRSFTHSHIQFNSFILNDRIFPLFLQYPLPKFYQVVEDIGTYRHKFG